MTKGESLNIAHLHSRHRPCESSQETSRLTESFCELRKTFNGLSEAIASMSSGYREDTGYLDEFHYQHILDTLTDRLHRTCVDIAACRATSSDHLKLKVSALLFLLPAEADAEIVLAKSLLADLDTRSFSLPISASN